MAKPVRFKVRVRDRDRGWRKLVRKVFDRKKFVTVGVHGEQNARGDGLAGNVLIMTVHEFGSERAGIPQRSVIRSTLDKNQVQYRRLMHTLGERVYQAKRPTLSTKQALEILGAKVASDMRQTIARTPGQWPALKPATIAAREFGGSKPLLDRAELQRSIKHKVGA